MTASDSPAPDTVECNKQQSSGETSRSPYVRANVNGSPYYAEGTSPSSDRPVPPKTKNEMRQIEYIRKLSENRQMQVRFFRACVGQDIKLRGLAGLRTVGNQFACRWTKKKQSGIGSLVCDAMRGRPLCAGHKSCLQQGSCHTVCLCHRLPPHQRHSSQLMPGDSSVPLAHLESPRRDVWIYLPVRDQDPSPRSPLHLRAHPKATISIQNACRRTYARRGSNSRWR